MNRMVLIADGNTTRGQRLAEACRSAGVSVKTGPHGAAALELALSDEPGLVVAQLDLPLVDAVKLAEILRANPRTRRSRFVFLGDGSNRPGGPGDVLLPGGARTDDVLRVIEELIEKQEHIDAVDRAAESGDRVSGDLARVPVSELSALFQANLKSGRLDLWREDDLGPPEQGRVLVRDGEVIQAECGAAMGEKAFFRMLAWRSGRFEFDPAPFDDPATIATPTRVLLVEGLRQLDEWNRLATTLPPLDAALRLRVSSGELPNIVHPLTQEVLLLLELYSTVREVVDHCSFPDYQVLRTLHTLAERELVEIGRVPPPTGPVRRSDGLFNDAQVRRLREWVETGRGACERLPSPKLLVAGSDPSALPDFARLLAAVPGASLDMRAVETGGERHLGRVGELEVGGGLGIDLVHVPRSERFAPLWPMAGQGALGTLFLLSGPVGRAAESLAGICEVLADLPRARTFHVVLLRKGERISPDELRDNLALIDEASLFLLPLESGKEPTALLRGLFARIVP